MIAFSVALVLILDEATLWSLAHAVRPQWVTRRDFDECLRTYGFRRVSHLDAAACFLSGAIVSLNLITTLLLAICCILHLPYHSHALWLEEEGAFAMDRAHAASAFAIDGARGSIISLIFSAWMAIFSISLKWAHLHGTPASCGLILGFIIVARATFFRSIACRIRDGDAVLPRAAAVPIPRSLRAWSRLLATVQGKGRLLGSECAICLAQLSGAEEIVVAACGHSFHTKCADSWEVTLTSSRVVRGAPPPLASPGSALDCGLWRRATPQFPTTSAAGAAVWLRALEASAAASATLTSCPLCRASRAAVVLPRQRVVQGSVRTGEVTL